MGLDMYFYRGHAEENHQIFYFRKHADLHGFLLEIWRSMNPKKTSDEFNCEEFEITNEILHSIENECKNLTHKNIVDFSGGHLLKKIGKGLKKN